MITLQWLYTFDQASLPKFLTSMTLGITDLQMDVMITGTDVVKALFDAKVIYRLTRHSAIKEGVFEFVRTNIENEVVNKIAFNGMELKLEDFKVDTDMKSKVEVTFKLNNKKFGVIVVRQAPMKYTVAMILNDQEYIMTDLKFNTEYKPWSCSLLTAN